MSYTRSYRQTLRGTVSGTVRYPSSQSGGTMSVSLEWEEPVHVDIHVDTDPFDAGVATVQRHVDGLTGAVVATEAAQVAQKVKSAEEVSRSVTDGFFKLIASDITQQMAATKSKIDSLLLSLADLAHAVQRIHVQMGVDYERITDRYGRIFEDLDRETQTRVRALDSGLFRAQTSLSDEAARPCGRLSSAVPAVFGSEASNQQASMVAAGIRTRMHRLLNGAAAFIATDRRLGRVFREMLVERPVADAPGIALPVLYFQADGVESAGVEKLHVPEGPVSPLGGAAVRDAVLQGFRNGSLPWKPWDQNARVDDHLNALVDGLDSGDTGHAARVRKTILELWSASKPSTLPA